MGWTPETCYNLSELQLANMVQALNQNKAQAKPGRNQDTTSTPAKPKITLNDKVALKAKKLGRKLTQAELFALL